MLLPFIATVSWKRQEDIEKCRSTGRHYEFTERADHGRQCFLFLLYHALKLKEMIEELSYIYKSTWYRLSPPPPSTFPFFFGSTNHQQNQKWPPHLFISPRCFSPWKYNPDITTKTQWQQGTVKCLDVTFFFFFFQNEFP